MTTTCPYISLTLSLPISKSFACCSEFTRSWLPSRAAPSLPLSLSQGGSYVRPLALGYGHYNAKTRICRGSSRHPGLPINYPAAALPSFCFNVNVVSFSGIELILDVDGWRVLDCDSKTAGYFDFRKLSRE
ncbi:hypothetical protein GALMADRAFT_231456 [Galerina marginata CBS 339.88]|uniref:Uncharacterized protein n=1 Tax=Galerina marginata (strain CBS 339.88) TaxID=685588 RepID=A0A067SN83_GALM3|nr:hypothetical protein GALMADRAFT_231456 [Galerina marginata CBS 339.88]